MIALIDGDTLAYRCAASCEPSKKKAELLSMPFEALEREPLDLAIQRLDELVYRILNTTQAAEYRIFISGSENFRKQLYPDYKANRDKLVRPQWLEACREFLVGEWKASVCAGYEADDGIGIAANGSFIICANDKDFRQIPGQHYNFVKDSFETLDEREAAYAFYSQLLIGDTSDNVRGVDGIGPIKAGRYLGNKNPEEMEHCVRQLYGDEQRYLLVRRLLRILRSEQEYEEIKKVINETTERKSQREESTEAGSQENFDPFSTINS